MSAPVLVTRRIERLARSPQWAPMIAHAAPFVRAQQAHWDLLTAAEQEHGPAYSFAPGRLSGGHFAHWPEAIKQRSRDLANCLYRLVESAYAKAPKRAHAETKRAVWLVAINAAGTAMRTTTKTGETQP